MHKLITSTLTTALVLPAALLLTPNDAEACSPGPENIQWTMPADDGVILPETPILLNITGEDFDGSREILFSRDGDPLDAALVYQYAHGLFSAVYALVPDEPLTDGTYDVDITYGDSEWSDDFSFTFSVNSSIDPGPLHGPVDFTWYQETLEQPSANSCYSVDQIQYLTIQPLTEEPYFYEISFHRDDQNSVRFLRRPQDIDGSLESYGVSEADCVELRPIGLNGEAGDSVELCQPDKCVHVDNTENFVDFGDVDWDQIDGCGDEEEEEQEEEEQEEEQEEEEEQEGGCSASGGGSPTPLAALLLVAALAITRRR